MLYVFTGTDSTKVRAKLSDALAKLPQGLETIRITDAHTQADLDAALAGGGMFGGPRAVVLESILTNEELRDTILSQLARLKSSTDTFYIYESAPDAATRKQIEKYAEASERYDAAKAAVQESIFGLVRSFQAGKKKDLWVGYQREIAKGKAPEAIHGILFYAAKDAVLRNPKDMKARSFVATLAELPHEARRAGFELEYALEHFVLSGL